MTKPLLALALVLPMSMASACDSGGDKAAGKAATEKKDDKGAEAKADDKAEPKADDKAAASDGKAEAAAKLLGTWVATDDSGKEVEFTKDTLKSTYPKSGGKPMVGPYKVEKAEGNTIEISTQIELDPGKFMPADNQVITLGDDGTMTMKNAKNGSGGSFKKK